MAASPMQAHVHPGPFEPLSSLDWHGRLVHACPDQVRGILQQVRSLRFFLRFLGVLLGNPGRNRGSIQDHCRMRSQRPHVWQE